MSRQSINWVFVGAGLFGGSPFFFAPVVYVTRATLAQGRRFSFETTRGMAGFNPGQIHAKFRAACAAVTKIFPFKPAAVTIGAPDQPGRLRDSSLDLFPEGITSWPTKITLSYSPEG